MTSNAVSDSVRVLEEDVRTVADALALQVAHVKDRIAKYWPDRTRVRGASIVVPRLYTAASDESAKLLDLLVLCYDKIFWDTPRNSLLIPNNLKDQADLNRFGVDEAFPDRFIQYMRLGIVTPFTGGPGGYSLPVESAQEHEIPRHMFYNDLPILVWRKRFPELFERYAAIATVRGVESTLGRFTKGDRLADELTPVIVPLLVNFVTSRALGVPSIFVGDRVEQLRWELLGATLGASGPMVSPARPLPFDTLGSLRLIEGLLLSSPCRLGVEEILRLRETESVQALRRWVSKSAERAWSELIASDPIDYIVQAFNYEVQDAVSRSRNSSLLKVTVSAAAAVLGAAVGGLPGAVSGAVAGFAGVQASELLGAAWHRHFGRVGWILNIHRHRQRAREGRLSLRDQGTDARTSS